MLNRGGCTSGEMVVNIPPDAICSNCGMEWTTHEPWCGALIKISYPVTGNA